MWFNVKNSRRSDVVTTVLGEQSHFKGVLNTPLSLRLEGSLDGEIHAQGEVHIGEKSVVRANVWAKRIVVAGEVIGNIEAQQVIEITKTGKVYGDIRGSQLIVEDGGIYKGKVNMDVLSSRNPYEGEFDLPAQS